MYTLKTDKGQKNGMRKNTLINPKEDKKREGKSEKKKKTQNKAMQIDSHLIYAEKEGKNKSN